MLNNLSGLTVSVKCKKIMINKYSAAVRGTLLWIEYGRLNEMPRSATLIIAYIRCKA